MTVRSIYMLVGSFYSEMVQYHIYASFENIAENILSPHFGSPQLLVVDENIAPPHTQMWQLNKLLKIIELLKTLAR